MSAESARAAVSRAIALGWLAPPTRCEACGVEAGDGIKVIHHHWSYTKSAETDVIPLCLGCHHRVHCGCLAEPRTGRVYPKRLGGKPIERDAYIARAMAAYQVVVETGRRSESLPIHDDLVRVGAIRGRSAGGARIYTATLSATETRGRLWLVSQPLPAGAFGGAR